MKGKLPQKMLCLLLSAILTISGTEMPEVYAQEETGQITEQEIGSAEQDNTSTETDTFDETVTPETQAEEDASSETLTSDNDTITESQPEEESSSLENPTETENDTDESMTEAENASTESNTDESETQEEITPQTEQSGYSLFVINPHYEEIIDDVPPIAVQSKSFSATLNAQNAYQNVQDAAAYLREQMVARADTVVLNVSASLIPTQDAFEAFVSDLADTAMAYTEDCSGQEGDALQWGYKTYQVKATGSAETYQLTFTITYHTSPAQEQALTTAVDSALDSMNLSGKSDYEKVKLIHDYICDHVDYDYTYTKYSAYDALCTGTAVCQGYAVLFYRMCKDAGLSVRIISGTGNGGDHGWNIVRIGQNARETGKYYNVDCTWDGQTSQTNHTYFLKCEADFVNHTRAEEYNTAAFHEMFPMAESSYVTVNSMNVDNISEILWVYDGDDDEDNDVSVKTTANGRPKVLVFIQLTCSRSQATVRDLAQNDFSDVDLYVILATEPTDNNAYTNFIRQYASGSNNITFAHYGNRAWNEYFNLAVDYAGWSGTENTPTVCYIDAQDKLQHMTSGQQTANAVRSNINTYCSGGAGGTAAYTITYILNGGINNTGNPSAYNPNSETITLLSPVKEGYTFAGWYTDEAMTQRITQIPKGSTGNLTLYAKWENNTQAPEDPSGFPQVDMALTEGNILMGIPGAYETETAETILKRLNDIRLEACKEGVIDPNTNKALTEADYKPLQWSSDLEAIARLRAAEASVRLEHTRPNGERCFTARTTNGEQSWAENLAWNSSGLMQGIEQWYGEKNDWVNQTGKVTGHYESIISTRYNYVAVSAFKLTKGSIYPVAVAQEFSDKTAMDSQKSTIAGNCVQDMEIAGSAVSKLAFESNSVLNLEAGSIHRPALNATAGFEAYENKTSCTGSVREGGTWTSSNTAVATVDTNGNITAVASGTATISVTVGTVSADIAVAVFNKGENPLQLTRPSKTTYQLGEQLDLSGGSVTFEGKTTALNKNMVNGFRSDTAGISKVTVTYGEYTTDFDTLIVEEPKLTATYGQTLSQLTLPANEHGKWNWRDTDLQQQLNEVGTRKFNVSFTPYDSNTFSERTDLQAEVSVHRSLEDMGITAELLDRVFVYNGAYHEPQVNVSVGNKTLVRNEDYTLTYHNNKNAGTGTVIVEGKGSYDGSIIRTFEIKPAKLVITAKNATAVITDIPTTFEFEISGLVIGESLVSEPEFICRIPSPAKTGIYDIIPVNAKATPNYDSHITYINGRLVIAEESVAYVVTFDVRGHGTNPEQLIGNAGTVVTQPASPTAEGYTFAGWYQDAVCTKVWNFETDILQSDLTLYAKWLMNSSDSFRVQEISDMYYTGKPCKPAVSVYDGNTLLTANKDYKISYHNNTNANDTLKTGNGAGDSFDDSLPYVTITGKGNYAKQFSVNFNILPAPIADAQGNPVQGVTLKYTDQVAVNAKKNAAPFQSIKYGKAMKQGKDFEISVMPANSQDKLEDGVIPAGMTGCFVLEIKGVGNYTGTIRRTIYVMDQSKLIKNAKITLGKNIKSVALKDYKNQQGKVEFEAAYYDQKGQKYYRVEEGRPTLELATGEQKNYFTVSCGGESLLYQKDFTVNYERNDRAGTASMIITGTGSQYVGQKTVTFQIKGEAFKANMVDIDGFQTEKTFTGTALTQNGVTLSYSGASNPLVYGKDYTICYKKNINKGTASMTFMAMEGSLYSGSFNKTFKILPADISNMEQGDSMKNIEVTYEKAGAKPAARILLRNPAGAALQYGRDYTVSYQNNKAVAKANDGAAAPTMTIKGKGNYTGTLERTYTILPGDFENENITTEITSVAYNPQKPETFEYKPSIKIKDGKSALKAAKDYEIEYINNDQRACTNYMDKIKNGDAISPDEVPSVTITPIQGSNYNPAKSITLPLPIHLNKLTASTLYVVPNTDETVYTGKQVCPSVQVYYNADSTEVAKAKAELKKGTPMNDTELSKKGFRLLQKDTDYTYSYGTNISAGNNKGSITILGTAPNYGNAVTVKFTITQKSVRW